MKKIFLLFLLISGCASNNGKHVIENQSDISEGRGIALFSTGAKETSTAFATGLRLVNGENHKAYDAIQILLDSSFQDSDIKGEYTNIRTLDLPVGVYYMTARALNPYTTVTRSPAYKFKIQNRKIVYIGNYYLKGNEIIWSQNAKSRDVKYFKDKNPNLKNITINSQHTPLMPGDKGFQIQGYIFGEP